MLLINPRLVAMPILAANNRLKGLNVVIILDVDRQCVKHLTSTVETYWSARSVKSLRPE